MADQNESTTGAHTCSRENLDFGGNGLQTNKQIVLRRAHVGERAGYIFVQRQGPRHILQLIGTMTGVGFGHDQCSALLTLFVSLQQQLRDLPVRREYLEVPNRKG